MRRKIRKVSSSAPFSCLFAFFIIANTIFIGVEVEYEAANGPAHNIAFTFLEHIFGLSFLIELLLHLVAQGPKRFFLPSKNTPTANLCWNYFDTFLVTTSVIEFALLVIFTETGSQVDGISVIRLVRVFRITRILRLLRLARHLSRIVAPLNVLMHSIISTLKAMVWVILLLVIDLYFFSIIFTQVANFYVLSDEGIESAAQLDASFLQAGQVASNSRVGVGDGGSEWDDRSLALLRQHWGSVPRSMLTLLETVSGGVDWDLVARPMGRIHWVCMLIFLTFFAVTFFAFLNVITGFFCQTAIHEAEHDREMMLRNLQENKAVYVANLKEQFRSMFEGKVEEDGTMPHSAHTISLDEFERLIKDDKVAGFFLLLDIDTEDAWTMFNLLDATSSGVIDAEEFVDGCLRLKGPAKSIDLATFRDDTRRMLDRMAEWMDEAEKNHQELSHHVKVIDQKSHIAIAEKLALSSTGGDLSTLQLPVSQFSAPLPMVAAEAPLASPVHGPKGFEGHTWSGVCESTEGSKDDSDGNNRNGHQVPRALRQAER